MILEHARQQPDNLTGAGQPVAADILAKRQALLSLLTQLSASR